MWQELHFSLRQIHRRRWFSAIVISLLALGIGANTLMFSLVNAFLWRPLSVRNPSNLFLVEKIRQQQVRPETDFNYQQFLQLTARRDLFSGVVAGQEWNKTTVGDFQRRCSDQQIAERNDNSPALLLSVDLACRQTVSLV